MAIFESDIVDASRWTHERLNWHLRACCDSRLRDRAKLLASLLLHDFDLRRGGCAWRGQSGEKGLAERAGWKDAKTVQLAAQELEAAGYIRIERGKGRGHSNRYWPLLGERAEPAGELAQAPEEAEEKADVDTPFEATEKGDADPPFSAEKADADPIKGGCTSALHRKDTSKNKPTAGACEAVFDRIVEACPKRMLRWADQGLAWEWVAARLDEGADLDPIVQALGEMAASPEFQSRKHPPQLHDWLAKGMWRGWLASAVEAARAAEVAGGEASAGSWAGPAALRAEILERLGGAFAATLDRCAVEGGRLIARTTWAHGRLREAADVIAKHGCELVAPHGGSQ